MTDTNSLAESHRGDTVLHTIPPSSALPPATQPFAGAVSLKVSGDDMMYTPGGDAHYYQCGASALNVLLSALQLALVAAPEAILDFGAGGGRVTRWLRAAFPAASISACDLRAQDMEFCRNEFEAETWLSGTDIEALQAPRKYDLIWVGSVLTHLSAENAGQLIDKLLSWTKPGGLLVVSTIGRVARGRNDGSGAGYIHPEAWKQIQVDYATLGFGYADYAGQDGYGLSLTKVSWLGKLVESMPSARVILLAEAAWDDLHDIAAIQISRSSMLRAGLAGSEANASGSHEETGAAELAAAFTSPEQNASALRARLEALESSTSWRLTKPLRAAVGLFRR